MGNNNERFERISCGVEGLELDELVCELLERCRLNDLRVYAKIIMTIIFNRVDPIFTYLFLHYYYIIIIFIFHFVEH